MFKDLSFKYIKDDFISGLIVFFVALPLCLGIALASGAPLFSGIIAGIVGGIIVGLFSGSALGVSGPAAGLTVIVLSGIKDVGDFKAFLVSVIIAGILQIGLGYIKAGRIAFFFPSSVIKGMLAAIGISIILKQIPHAMGLDNDPAGDDEFFQLDGETTFSEILKIGDFILPGAFIIGLVSLLILIIWDTKALKKFSIVKLIPGSILAIAFGLTMNYFFPPDLKLGSSHLVNLPLFKTFTDISNALTFPNFSYLSNIKVWILGGLIAIIASLETLLCVEATDKLDPKKRITPVNKELFAQGLGNIMSGLIGGLPVTQVIVRSSANIQSGGKTKLSVILHGIFMLGSVLFFATFLNQIPLAALAAILITVGFKLAKPSMFKDMFKEGINQFIPFIATIIAIIATDLLKGILFGLLIGVCFVLFTNFKSSALMVDYKNNLMIIKFKKDIFFFNKASIIENLEKLKEGDSLYVDAANANFIDHDVFLTIKEFQDGAHLKKIKVDLNEFKRIKIKNN